MNNFNEIKVNIVVWIYDCKYGLFHIDDISEAPYIVEQLIGENLE